MSANAAKAEAMRSQAEFFLSIDMPIAADHCYEAAIAYEAPGPVARRLDVTLRSHHIVSANATTCLNCGKHAETTDPCMPAKAFTMMPPRGNS